MNARPFILLLAAGIVLGLFSCSTKKSLVRKNNRKVERAADRRTGGAYVAYTPEAYIRRFSKVAVRKMKTCRIPASITLAQALLESGTGNSSLARYANNHFGIKCTPDWKGKKYYKDDDRKDECFRVYRTPEESFRDHSEFLKRPRYAALYKLKPTDYKGWAHGLKAAGYATNPDYPQLLIGLIERYDLHRFDRRGKRKMKHAAPPAHTQRKAPAAKSATPAKSSGNSQDSYTVRSGDTLYGIARRFGLTVEQLKQLNGLRSNTIRPGQKLIIQ
jgi:LysM repeat protein